MRKSSVAAFVAAVLASCTVIAVGCAASPAVTVIRLTPGQKSEDIKGDALKLKRGLQDVFDDARIGFHVVRTPGDWQRVWPSGKVPPALPSPLDTGSQMLFLAKSKSSSVTNLKIERALETATFLHVWVHETKIGEGCSNKSTERAYDAVSTTRIDKPVKFYVLRERDESCGDPPVAKAECRLVGQETWATKIEAQPGDSVECMLTSSAQGKFEIVDRLLSMADLPAGSTAKLAFKKGPQRGEFEVDVYGTYAVLAEASDEGGRRGNASASIEVLPPKTKDVLVQLVWAGFDRMDTSDTFPRVNLRVAEEGPKGQRCSAEIPIPGLCDVKTRGAYTYMRIPEGTRKLPISVQYLDERYEKGPGPCVHVWYDGARTAETCDRNQRESDEIWRIGTLDTATGALAIEGAPAPADAGPPDAPAK